MDAPISLDRLRFLQSHALFGGLTDEQMQLMVSAMKESAFAPGAAIVREGEPGNRMYFLLSGAAEVLKDATPDIPDDQEFARITLLKAGDAFGEMGLIDTQSRSASVVAREAVTTLSLSGPDLLRIHHSHPEVFTMIILNLARELSRRLRRMDERVAWRK